MSNTNLSLAEFLIINQINESRRSDLSYLEKKVKGEIDRVTVELTGHESGVFTKLADKYASLEKAIKALSAQREELNAAIKEKSEDFFAPEDVVYTRVIDTISFTYTLSKRYTPADKTTIDYAKIVDELVKLIPDELQAKVEEITAAYTKIIPGVEKSPALTVKAKVTEGIIDELSTNIKHLIKRTIKNITGWARSYDKKLNTLKKDMAGE